MQKRKITIEVPIIATRVDVYETTRTNEEIACDLQNVSYNVEDLNPDDYELLDSSVDALSEQDDKRYPVLAFDEKSNDIILSN